MKLISLVYFLGLTAIAGEPATVNVTGLRCSNIAHHASFRLVISPVDIPNSEITEHEIALGKKSWWEAEACEPVKDIIKMAGEEHGGYLPITSLSTEIKWECGKPCNSQGFCTSYEREVVKFTIKNPIEETFESKKNLKSHGYSCPW